MKRKVYWKDLFASFTHSKGRILSILTLMLLGSLALVGLKVTTPNMHRTANQFIQQQKMLNCFWGSLKGNMIMTSVNPSSVGNKTGISHGS